jgi:hypothetical protein
LWLVSIKFASEIESRIRPGEHEADKKEIQGTASYDVACQYLEFQGPLWQLNELEFDGYVRGWMIWPFAVGMRIYNPAVPACWSVRDRKTVSCKLCLDGFTQRRQTIFGNSLLSNGRSTTDLIPSSTVTVISEFILWIWHWSTR